MKHHASIVCAPAAALSLFGAVVQANDAPAAANSLVGAWEVEVTVREPVADCSTAAPVGFGPNPFPALNTFHQGGTVSETGSRWPPSNRSPGHGVWERIAGRDYAARVEFQIFDDNGFLSYFMDVRSEIRLARDGHTFSATGRLLFTDTSGNTVPFCHSMEGVRITL